MTFVLRLVPCSTDHSNKFTQLVAHEVFGHSLVAHCAALSIPRLSLAYGALAGPETTSEATFVSIKSTTLTCLQNSSHVAAQSLSVTLAGPSDVTSACCGWARSCSGGCRRAFCGCRAVYRGARHPAYTLPRWQWSGAHSPTPKSSRITYTVNDVFCPLRIDCRPAGRRSPLPTLSPGGGDRPVGAAFRFLL